MLEFRGYTLDPSERVLVRGTTPVKLRPRPFDLLCALVASAGQLVPRAQLKERVWAGVYVSDEVLKVCVCELRSALRDDAHHPVFIETVAKSGYRFVAPVAERSRSARPVERAPETRSPPPMRSLAPAKDGGRRSELLGRERELAHLRQVLEGPTRVVYIHGIGGIGKTSLLTAFTSACREAGHDVLRVDARDIACLPKDLLRAIAAARGTRTSSDPLAALRRGRGRAAVLIDSYEYLAPLDRWIREELCPALPPRVLLVLAGRLPPSAEWRGEPGWNDTMKHVPLGELSEEAARRVLRARGAPPRRDRSALALAHGHPLALCLIADLIARRPAAPLELERAPDIVQSLLARVVRDVRDERQQAALDACCLPRQVNEPLLAAMIGGRDARALIRWLASLSFIELGKDGVFPHDLARSVLLADLKWRNPDLLTTLVERASAHLVDRLRSPRAARTPGLADELLFLHSHHPVIGAFTPWRGADGLVVEPARPEDHAKLVDIVARHEGASAAAIAASWLRAQPEGALVARDGARDPAGFELTLRLDRATDAEIAADPASRQVMEWVRKHGGARRGHAILIHRFLMARDTYHDHSPVQSVLGSQCVRAYLTTPRLDWAFTCLSDPERWSPVLKAAFDADVLPPFVQEGRRYGIFVQAFRERPPTAWLAWLASRDVREQAGAVDAPSFDRAALRDEVRATLLDGHDRSDGSLILASLARRARGGGRRRRSDHELVRDLLAETAASLAREPGGEKLYAVIRHAYLEPAPTQRIAAARAGMSFSTYRRTLHAAVERIVVRLWEGA